MGENLDLLDQLARRFFKHHSTSQATETSTVVILKLDDIQKMKYDFPEEY